MSRPDRSGADQSDVEHQATDLAVRSDCPLSAPTVGATTLRLACALARLILGDLEQESARPVGKALTTGPWAGRTRKEVKGEPAGQEEGDRRDLNPRPSGPQPDALTN